MASTAVSRNIHAIIVGGGIGGLTAARALTLKGVTCTVLDQAAHFTPTAGAGFGFSPNGQMCLKYLKLENEIASIVHPFVNHKVFGRNNNLLYEGDFLHKYLQSKAGYALGSALRADLVKILVDSLQDCNSIQYSKKVIDIKQKETEVEVILEESTPPSQG